MLTAAEKPVKMTDLPAAVQKSIQEQTKGATIKGVAQESEAGKTVYEVETTLDGKGRDLTFDTGGKLVELEEEVPISSIPAAAKTAIETRAAGATITKVEKVTEGQSVKYEAALRKGTKRSEISVTADGMPAK